MEELDGPQDVELAGHEELDSHIPGERGHIVLACPLVDLLQELLGCLWERSGVRPGEEGEEGKERECPRSIPGHCWSYNPQQAQQLLGVKQGAPQQKGYG